ncbi:hypothetical protein Ddc_12267 [Ditylenchus destructor]|nr:hypothetical protein Ddc_12267 [Ditylenchus destructor]
MILNGKDCINKCECVCDSPVTDFEPPVLCVVRTPMCLRRKFAKDESTEARLNDREKTVGSNLFAPGMPDRINYGRDNWDTISMGSSTRNTKFKEDVATVMTEPKQSKKAATKHGEMSSDASADKPPILITRDVSDFSRKSTTKYQEPHRNKKKP